MLVIGETLIPILTVCLLLAGPNQSYTQDNHNVTRPECQDVSQVLGFAVVDVEDGAVLRFYTKPVASDTPALTVRLVHDNAINSITHRVDGAQPFRPATLHLDYDLLELSVKHRSRGWLNVVVDEQTGKTLWMQDGADVTFVDWLSRMRRAFSIERTNKRTNQLRTMPRANARHVQLRERDCFEVVGMRGDWINVIQQTQCDESSGTSVRGWIRWRNQRGCLLVEIYPFA